MKKILWLPSWYPSKIDGFTGDFIQRHARAVALYLPLTVIYIVKDEKGIHTNDVLAETNVQERLHETIIYYKPFAAGIGFIDKFFSSLKYFSVYKKYIRQYIAREGKPAFIHVHVPIRAGIPALWCKKKYGIPFIVTEHWCAYNTLNPRNFFTHSAVFRRLSKKIFESAAMVTTVCESNRKELHSLFNIKKSVIIHNVADGRLFYPGHNNSDIPFVFVHVSSLTSQKNVTGILDALNILKNNFQNWRCVIAGPPDPALINYAVRCGLQEVIEWTGEIPYELVALHMRSSHCMVMFSRYENSPCTIIEALSAGLPVITSNVGGIPEIVNENNGLMVASEDVTALARAMEQMIYSYQKYNCGSIAEKAKQLFSYETVGAQIASLYSEGV
ncbi:MAG: glycosyltransferase [Bacteroidota bacterium]